MPASPDTSHMFEMRGTPSLSGPRPETGKGLPIFTLLDTTGTIRRLWDFKQRHPVALFVPHAPDCAGCRAWLRDLSASHARLDELGAAVLVLVRAPCDAARALQTDLDAPFTILVDADGSVACSYADSGAASLDLGDRYLQRLGSWIADDGHELPAPDEVIGILACAEQEDCGCGLPAWPEDAL